MPMEGGQDSLSNVNNPYETDTKDDEKLEIEETKSPELVEWKPNETVSLDDKPVVPESGEEAVIENQVVAEESKFIEEPEPPVEQAVAEEGDTETIVAQSVAQPVVPESGEEAVIENQVVAEETKFIEEPEPPVEQAVAEEGDTETIFAQTVAQPLEMKVELEVKQVNEVMVPAVVVANTGDESLAADSEMDDQCDELPVEPQQEMKNEEEFTPVVNAKVDEGLVSDVGIAQQSSELEMEGRADELSPVREGTLALELDYRAETEGEIGDTVMVEEVGGEYNELVENSAVKVEEVGGEGNELVENNTENDVDGYENGEDKANVVASDSEVGHAEKPASVEDEKVDPVITEEMPITEVKTEVDMISEVNENVVDVTEKDPELSGVGADVGDERAEDGVVANESLIPGTVMVEDGNMSMEASEDLKIDEPVNVVANKEEIIKEELLEGDTKAETEIEVELDLIGSNVVEEIELADADMETETGTDKFVDEDNKIETEETSSDADEDALEDDEDEQMVAEEETGTQDTEMETETDVAESEKTSGGKPKRGKLSKSPPISKARASSRKTVGEDVCFICFDGGELVLCDRRGCPKAYHPSCVNRDEAFFKSKGRWNCGWHLCSICEKNARYMCYTCTFSLCKSCTKDAVISCVRGNKGFCETCMRTVLLIENNEHDNNTQVDFDDKSSWEYLFKDYYLELKSKLSLSSVEIAEAKNPCKGADRLGPTKQESSEAQADAIDGGSASDNDVEDIKTTRSKRRKVGKQSKPTKRRRFVSTGVAAGSLSENSEWASKELLEFVSHMNDGDTSVLNQYDVQQLLLEYIKRNKLRDPRKKSQIICDARLQNLFGKARCGHFEMLKLLESHYFIRDEQNDDVQGSVVNTENNLLDIDGSPGTPTKGVKDKKKRNTRKKVDPRYNLDDFAAIDMHNISLIYLRRKLMEDLLEEADRFHDKVVGTFVRIRISGSTQKQDLYRLVQVVGTSKAAEPYKVGKKTTDIMVEILNLDKTEIIQIDTISNQEFTEEECKRLRQSIKCGLISRLTVGEILDKATEIQTVRVNDWIESEILRLTHLRDRASDMGLKKGLRESVEKLDLLKTPGERRRRLEEIPEILADPKMDPSYESDEKESESEESRRDAFMRSRGYGFIRRGKGPISPVTDNSVKDSWSGAGKVPNRIRDMTVNEDSRMSEKEIELKISERYNRSSTEYDEWSPRTASRSESFSGVTTVTPQASLSTGVSETSVKINESEKMWHYKDPSGKQQGPFSVVQLRKWNNTGYFPADLRIWKATEKQENSILLADALAGKFPEQSPVQSMFPAATNTLHSPHGKTSLHQDRENSIANPNQGYVSKLSTEKWAGNELTNLPSPTPRHSNAGWSGGEGGLVTAAKNQAPVVSGLLSSPNAVIPNIGTHSSASASGLNSVVQTGTGFSPIPNTQSTMMSQQPHSAQMQAHAPTGVQPVHNVISQNLPSGQPQGYNWNTSNVQNPSGTLTANVQPDVWHPSQGSQPNMQPPVTPNVPWSMGPAVENNTSMGVGPENPNSGWGTMQANPNMGWGNMAPQNINWGTTMQAPPPGNTNSGWIPPAGNIQGMVAGNMNSGWVPPPVNGWVPPSGNAVGPPQGNANQGWGPPQGNQVSWGGEQSPGGGGQFSGQSGGGVRPWNRQPSFGGGGSRKRDVVCPYNAKGRCRKGNRCDYMHI